MKRTDDPLTATAKEIEWERDKNIVWNSGPDIARAGQGFTVGQVRYPAAREQGVGGGALARAPDSPGSCDDPWELLQELRGV